VNWNEIPVQENLHVGADSAQGAGRRAVEATDNGIGALAVWYAGPAHAFRLRGIDASRRVTVVCTFADGRQQRTSQPYTEADQAEIDEDINAYLEEAGIAPRPPGFRWFIRVPAAIKDADSFYRCVCSEMYREIPMACYPAEHRRAVETVLPRILASPRLDQ